MQEQKHQSASAHRGSRHWQRRKSCPDAQRLQRPVRRSDRTAGSVPLL